MLNTLLEKTKGKDFDRKFLQCLKCDGMMTVATGRYQLDVFATDVALSKMDPDYDNVKGTYKGEPASMNDYVAEKYGDNYVQLLNDLME